MTSQTDIDQGGTSRQWVRTYLGPSVGWIYEPLRNVLAITATGTYILDRSTNLVTVNVVGAVSIVLPTCIVSPSGAQAQPGTFAQNPITIVDIGGNANAHNITIQPNAGETIMGLASILINSNYGGYILQPQSNLKQWTNAQ